MHSRHGRVHEGATPAPPAPEAHYPQQKPATQRPLSVSSACAAARGELLLLRIYRCRVLLVLYALCCSCVCFFLSFFCFFCCYTRNISSITVPVGKLSFCGVLFFSVLWVSLSCVCVFFSRFLCVCIFFSRVTVVTRRAKPFFLSTYLLQTCQH